MKTPICDYVNRYAQNKTLRLHMPGHKGEGVLGVERLDITEIPGADSLYEASGIIWESEQNASTIFGCPTFYSTEGSSQCIRAMMHLAMLWAKGKGRKPVIAAGRNAHKAFLSAAALLDADVRWLYGRQDSYLCCHLTVEDLEMLFTQDAPTAVYLTSPDYLGNVVDVKALAEVCHRHDALLLVDNAHGAYLHFLAQHPMTLGADLCCDSAHKTLPVLTGGAYLHTTMEFAGQAKDALALFGSTSPSYLILQSLDACNPYLVNYGEKLRQFLSEMEQLRARLTAHGYLLYGNEPMKLTLCTKPFGYEGTALAACLEEKGIVCEFADPDFVVLMPTPETDLALLEKALLSVERQSAISEDTPGLYHCERVLSIRKAALSVSRRVKVEEAVGRVLASPSVGCPPAVPIVVCGERIDEKARKAFLYYGITHCLVVDE